MKAGNFNWMKGKESKASVGANCAMKSTQKLLMKIAGSK